MKKSKTLKVDYLARVEGEGSLYIGYSDEGVEEVKLKIFEPPRFFEALLRGRDYLESPDITARICGICPVAYQMSAVHAMENALGITIDPPLRELRRLLYCGEWIESHVLHIYLLHAPDFLGYDSAVAMAGDYPDLVQRGLQMKSAGNAIIRLLGGREIHPINVRVGGFYRVPDRSEFAPLREQLLTGRELAIDSVRWAAALAFPEFKREPPLSYNFVALRHPDEYPMNAGQITSSSGLAIAAADYEAFFTEQQVAHSTALHSVLNGQGAYLVGPMARFKLNYDQLSPLTRQLAQELDQVPDCNNPFHSIVVRSLEVVYAFDEALRIIDHYQKPDQPWHSAPVRAATGFAATEAPRGLLYHRYEIGADGKILAANIVPPTSQNQKTIEEDLRYLVPRYLQLPEDQLRHLCEQAIRNYDPCISCAAHFLTLDRVRHP